MDNTPPEKRPEAIGVKGAQGEHVHVHTMNVAGHAETTFLNQSQDTRESLQERISILEKKMEALQKEWEDRKLQIQNLEGDLRQQQQDYAKAENTSQAKDQIRRLTTEIEMHTSKLAMLEDDILPTLKVQIERVQEQLAEYEKTAPEQMKALKEQMQTLSGDLEKYGADVTDGRKKVEDLSKQIQQLEEDISDKRKQQEAKMQDGVDALRDIQVEQGRQKKQLENEHRAIEELQRVTQKQDDEMKKLKSDNIKLKDEKEAAERKIQELEERDALREKQIQDLTEQKQKASSDRSHGERAAQMTTHASSDPSRTTVTTTKKPATQATPSPADCEDLFDASGAGNLEEVKRILSQGVDVNCRWRSGTPVMWAAGNGHRDVVELLVSEGADVSLVDKDGDNTLHFACIGGDVETVKFVLSLHVVDIDARTNSGQTAAGWARLMGHTRVADLLVSRGAQ